MTTIRGEILIQRPVTEVFDFVADERNEPTFNPAMTDVTMVTVGEIGPGTRFSATVTSRGRPLGMVVEITELDRPTRIGTVTTMASAQVRGALTFAPVDGGTRMGWEWDVEPTGALRFLSPLVAWVGKRQEDAIWAGLKRHLESTSPGAGPDRRDQSGTGTPPSR